MNTTSKMNTILKTKTASKMKMTSKKKDKLKNENGLKKEDNCRLLLIFPYFSFMTSLLDSHITTEDKTEMLPGVQTRRRPSVEDNLRWTTIFGGRGPSADDDLWW